jgi:putative peptide zinc metalloprotease protein
MTARSVARDDVVALDTISVTDEGTDLAYIGDRETGDFFAVPAVGGFVVRRLQAGHSLDDVERQCRDVFGEPVDVRGFVADLATLGLARPSRDHTEDDDATVRRQRGIVLLGGIAPDRCRWLWSPAATALAVAAWAALPVLLALGRLPRAADVLVYPDLLTLLTVFVPVAWLLMCLHELAHSLTARAVGCEAYTRFGNRFWNLVCETDLSTTYALPRRSRLRPLLAGMTWDVLVLDVCLALELAAWGGRPPYVVGYMVASTLVYQTFVFMRTDLYYVVTTLTRSDNLVPAARAEVARWARTLTGAQRNDRPTIGPRRLVVLGYLALCAVALGFGVVSFLHLTLPATVGVVRLGVEGLAAGVADHRFWTATFVLAFLGFVYATLLWTFVRNSRERRRAASVDGRVG